MKLYAEDIVPLHTGCKGLTVVGNGRDPGDHRRAIGVREINKAIVRHSLEQMRMLPSAVRRIWFQPTCGTLSVVSKRLQLPSKSASPWVSGASVEPANCHCIPTQMPRNGVPRSIACSTASRTPLVASRSVVQKWPTPGSTSACASRTCPGSSVTTVSCPRWVKALRTLVRLPAL